MSQSPQDLANVGRKRTPQAMMASLPHRPRKRRNVVDSSPVSELTQLDSREELPPNDSDSENGIVDTQLQRMDEVQPNDPSIDWRQLQDGQDEIDNSDADSDVGDTDHEDAVSEDHVLPIEMQEAERFATARATETHEYHAVHRIYRTFLANLCSQTNTQAAESVVIEGLPWIIWRNRSIGLENNLSSQRTLDIYAHALVIHVWLVVCRRIQQGELPPDSTLVLEMGSYFTSAHTIMQDNLSASYNELKDAVMYWEKRPITLGTRCPWQNERWLRELPQPDITACTRRNETAEAYLEALARGGKAELAVEIILRDHQDAQRHPLRTYTKDVRADREWVVDVILSILAAMNIEILKAVIDGSLTRKAEIFNNDVSNGLQAMMNRIQDQENTPPAIYMNSICDNMGVSPTPLQWQTVCNLMFEYISPGRKSNDLALEVDQLIHPDNRWPPNLAKKGLRRYTEWRTYVEQDGDIHPNESHRDMVKLFANQMQTRIEMERMAGRGHTPLDAPVIEIGFSINWRRRLREHRQHQNSNYLMNLAEALFKHAYPGSFHLQQLVIYTCYKVSQCWVSEIVLTQLGQGYTDGAGGFSHYTAGRSNGSAYKKTGRDDWVRFKYEAYQSGVLEAEQKKIANEAQQNLAAEEAREKHIQWLRALDDALGTVVEWSTAERQLQQQGGSNGS